jgi:hypothetical protein
MSAPLQQEDRLALGKPARVYTDPDGYTYDETAPWWKSACAVLPCFETLAWPGYATAIVEDTIDGRPVVIQLWKGWCQRFLGSPDFPGGIGAEVGVYERVDGRALPSSLSFLEPQASAFFTTAVAALDHRQLWWPATMVKAEIEFELVNPLNDKVFFRAGPETTYWLNKWMHPLQYIKYQRKCERRWSFLPWWVPGNSRTPPLATGYRLKYRINGKSYPAW